MSSLNKKNLPILGRGLFLALSVAALVGCSSDGTTSDTPMEGPRAGDPKPGAMGKVFREYWLALPGGDQFTKVLRESTVKMTPSGSDSLLKLQSTGFNGDTATTAYAHDFGERIRGFIKPPMSGTYYFGVSGDNQTAFFLSVDDRPKSVDDQIASCIPKAQDDACASDPMGSHLAGAETLKPEYTMADTYTQTNQISKPVTLDASKYYYFDWYHREGGGDVHAEVVWVKPGDPAPTTASKGLEIVPGTALYYPDFPAAPMGAGGAAAK